MFVSRDFNLGSSKSEQISINFGMLMYIRVEHSECFVVLCCGWHPFQWLLTKLILCHTSKGQMSVAWHVYHFAGSLLRVWRGEQRQVCPHPASLLAKAHRSLHIKPPAKALKSDLSTLCALWNLPCLFACDNTWIYQSFGLPSLMNERCYYYYYYHYCHDLSSVNCLELLIIIIYHLLHSFQAL